MEFKRSDDLLYPQIYCTFRAKDEEFYITDLTEVYADEALDLIVKYVIPEENFCKALKIHTKPNAVKVMSGRYRELFKQRMSLACFKKDSGELVGLNVLGVTTKGEKKVNTTEDPDLLILRESRNYTESLYDVFKKYPIDNFLDAFGLGVKSEYRGNGIAVELLKARIPLLKALGLKLTMTSFSTLSSQKAAVKAGFTENFAISYEELQIKFPHYDFSTATGSHSRIFILEIE